MTHDERLNDLKQFIVAMLGQTEVRLSRQISQQSEMLRREMKEGFAGVGEALVHLNDDLDKRFAKQDARLDDHDRQLAELRRQHA